MTVESMLVVVLGTVVTLMIGVSYALAQRQRPTAARTTASQSQSYYARERYIATRSQR